MGNYATLKVKGHAYRIDAGSQCKVKLKWSHDLALNDVSPGLKAGKSCHMHSMQPSSK